MISELIAALTIANLLPILLVMFGGFFAIIFGLALLKYFKYIFTYAMIFCFVGAVLYAGWIYWPV